MRLRPQADFLDPLEQFQERGVARQIGAQYQCIHEKTDQSFDFQSIAIGDGRAHAQIGLAAVA